MTKSEYVHELLSDIGFKCDESSSLIVFNDNPELVLDILSIFESGDINTIPMICDLLDDYGVNFIDTNY